MKRIEDFAIKKKQIQDYIDAENFNNFFANVGLNLSKVKSKRLAKTKSVIPFSLSLSRHKKCIRQKKLNKLGYDGMSNRMLKIIQTVPSEPLADIFNSFFEHGMCPKQLKTAKVIPLYESGEKDHNNYRPISLISSISKNMEVILQRRMLGFINKHGILSSKQFDL